MTGFWLYSIALCVLVVVVIGVGAEDRLEDVGVYYRKGGRMSKVLRLENRVDGVGGIEKLQRIKRSPGPEDDVGDEDPEGRHLHKIKRKLKPHKFGHHYGGGLLGANYYPAFGAYPGVGGCRTFGGCGGLGWHRPQFGGGAGGPIAAAFAGPSYGPGGGGGGWGFRPNAQSQVATWNLGPFQGSFGFANAG